MSKSNSKGVKDTKVNVLSKVKTGAVTKPAQTQKSKSKGLAKEVAAKEEKKSKKKVKEPTPEPSSEEEEESDSASSSGSEDDSEAESKPIVSGKASAKANGVKPAAKAESSDESDSEESDSEADAAPTNGAIKGTAAAAESDESASDASEDDDSESEVEKPAKVAKAVATTKAAPAKEDSSDSDESESEDEKPVKVAKKVTADASDDDSDEEDSEEDSDASDDSEESEVEVQTKTTKRKAEEEPAPAQKKSKVEPADSNQSPNLFVGNLSWNVDQDWLRQEFEEFGELSGVRLMMDRATGRSKGFGYVEFVNGADAAKAHAAKQGAELDGRAMNVDFANAKPTGERQDSRRKSYGDQVGEPSATLFCGNLSFDATNESISDAFAPHGTIIGVRLPTDRETGAPKGYGYVEFASVDEAKGALEAMQGGYINSRPVRLDYSQPRPQNGDSPARGGFGGRGRGGFNSRGGGRGGGRGDFRGGRGGARGGRPNTTNRGGFGDFQGKKMTF